MPWLRVVLMAMLLCVFAPVHAAPQAMAMDAIADATAAELALLPFARIVRDADGRLDEAEILRAAADGSGERVAAPTTSFGFDGAARWFSVRLVNPSTATLRRLLVFEPTWLDDVQVTLVRPDGGQSRFSGGDRLPFDRRAVDDRRANVLLTLPPGESRLIVRVATRDPFLFGMTLWDESAFFAAEQGHAWYFGLVYGAVAALLIFNLALFFSVRERIYAAYVTYLGSFLVLHATYNGHLFQRLWPRLPDWNNWAHSLFIYAFMLAALVFATQFLELSRRLPRAARWTRRLGAAALLTMLVTALAGGYRAQIVSAFAWVFVISPYSVLLGFWSWRSGNPAARYFLLATAAGFAGAFVTAAAVAGLLPISLVTYRALEIGMLIDATLLSLALADRLRLSRLQADAAKSELIEATRRYARQLESTVAERTYELSAANASLSRAIEDLREADRVKSHFFAAASHDLRQPIHAMALFIDALKRTAQDGAAPGLVASIETALGALRELLDALLDISRLDSGAVVPQPAPVPVTTLFEEIDAAFAALAQKRGLRFKFWFPRAPVMLDVDKRLLLGVLNNVVGNALKYTPHGGILLALRRRGDGLAFQVWDTGKGIAAEHRERIFDEYFQVDNPHRDRTQGMGLGLAIARRLCRLQGFRLSCRSTPGRGSLFEIVMPATVVAPADAAPHLPAAPAPTNPETFRGKRLVLVEDDRWIVEALRDLLSGLGMDVVAFATAEEALAAPELSTADYFIVDYQLAGRMNGCEFLDVLAARASAPVRAVVISGNTSEDFVRTLRARPWPHLFKPVGLESILAALAGQLSA